jgi:hypothetical protein
MLWPSDSIPTATILPPPNCYLILAVRPSLLLSKETDPQDDHVSAVKRLSRALNQPKQTPKMATGTLRNPSPVLPPS